MGDRTRRARIAPPAYGEDCLALNIWSPEVRDHSLKPVMVWIHGGAFVAGSGDMYDGAHLARDGDIVVVTINYRLGVLGFVNFGDVLEIPEISSNLGLRDQIAALAWVKDNIAAFGGDPARVTIAGESAGSISVALLMLCPRAWPLFHGAIMQSGAVSLIHDKEKSLAVARHYADRLGLGRGDLGKLRSLGLPELLEAQARMQAAVPDGLPAAPWFDGDLCPASFDEALAADTADVPLLAGFCREETRTFELMPGPNMLPLRRGECERLVRQQIPAEQADRILAAYPDTRSGNRALATHLTFALPTLHFAERHAARGHETWFYRFDYAHPIAGAAHGLDLAYLWSFRGFLAALARGGPAVGRRRRLAERIRGSWTAFIRNRAIDASWPTFTPERRTTCLFNLRDQILDDPEKDHREAWGGTEVGVGLAGERARDR